MAAETSPIELLKQEHRLVLSGLQCLRTAERAIESGIPAGELPLAELVEFLDSYLGSVHHAREGALFDLVRLRGSSDWDEVIGQLEEEHSQGRQLLLAMQMAIGAFDGATAGRENLVLRLRGFVGWHWAHIARENTVIFPELEGLLTPEESQRLIAFYERLDHDLGDGGAAALEHWGRELFEDFADLPEGLEV